MFNDEYDEYMKNMVFVMWCMCLYIASTAPVVQAL